MSQKQRFYPVRNAADPTKVTLEPITEEQYRALYPEIWRTQKQMRKLGRCVCPTAKLWACDADCLICEHCAVGNQISIDSPISDAEDLTLADTLADDAPTPESIALDCDLLQALYEELARLDPEGKRICALIAAGKSEREAAKIMDLSRSTFKRHWAIVQAQLAEALESFYY